MKSYDDLTKKEKDKLIAYIQIKDYMTGYFSSLIIIVFMLVSFSYVLFSFNTTLSIIEGIALLIGASLFILLLGYESIRTKKVCRIIFDIEDFQEELFNIKDSNIADMRPKYINPIKKKVKK